jgi:RNA polymerase sigma factor (sigma-70 family)
MQDQSDAQLLRDYAERGHEAAIRELIARHTDLVYSAALRQVGSPDVACDIAQSVFTDLARKASSLTEKMTEGGSLVGWLYRSTRFAALTLMRDDRRRLAHERQAMEQLITNAESDMDWERVRPVLDEAMAELSDEDREALLLRFFKNHDLRSVGQALGVSDDAAQKRVSRAVERLRALFAKRGMAVGGSALIAVVSANAVQAAPVGLTVTISTATAIAGTAVAATATSTAATVTQAVVMTTLQKTIVGAAFVAVLSTGIYQAREAANARAELRSLHAKQSPLVEQLEALTRERDEARRQLAALQDDNTRLNRNTSDLARLRGDNARLRDGAKELAQMKSAAANPEPGLDSTVKSWATRATLLRQRLKEKPNEMIPEVGLLTDSEWLEAMKDIKSLDSDDDFRQATGSVRKSAKQKLGELARQALKKYAEANGGMLPTDFAQLKPYFDRPADDALFQRYELRQSGKLNDISKNDFIFAEIAPHVDLDHDVTFQFGMNTTRSTGVAGAMVLDAAVQFAQAHNDQLPTDASQLTPYLKLAVNPTKVQQLISGIPPNITTLAEMKAAGMLK